MSRMPRLASMTKPACFRTEAEWRDWFKIHHGADTPCTDCTREYQAQMIQEGRCEHPETLFARIDGELMGIRGTTIGYIKVLRAAPYMPGAEKQMLASQTIPARIRTEIEAWAQRGQSNG